MTETEIEQIADTLFARSQALQAAKESPRFDMQSLGALAAILALLAGSVHGYATTQERLGATVEMVGEVRDDVRALRGEVAGLDALEVRVEHLEQRQR